MSISHIILLIIVSVIVIPPEKLPEVARQAARLFNDLRRATGGLWDDIKKETAFSPADILKTNINNVTAKKSEDKKSEEKKSDES